MWGSIATYRQCEYYPGSGICYDCMRENIEHYYVELSYFLDSSILEPITSSSIGRTQRVVVEGVASEWSPVTSGVPQGSILGPMLFLLFINDIPDAIPQATSTGLYADDAKLYRAITSNEDSACLQTALSCAGVWSVDSNITFNTSKCKIRAVNTRYNCNALLCTRYI
jgi:hypothetical protein